MKNIDETTYRVMAFAFYPLDDESWVLQTTERVNIVNNELLIQVLKEIKDCKYVTSTILEDIVKNNKKLQQIIKYLQNNNILTSLHKLNFDLKRSIFITNDKDVYNFMDLHYFDNVIYFEDVMNLKLLNDRLIVAVLNPYNPELVKDIYNKIQQTNSYLLLGFIYNFKFYIDNIYNSQLEFPDHFDHLKYIQSGIYSDQSNYTYQDMVNIIFEKDKNFNLIYPLSWLDIVMISRLILQRCIEIFDLDNNINLYMNDNFIKIQDMDLKTFKVKNDSANYWEMG